MNSKAFFFFRAVKTAHLTSLSGSANRSDVPGVRLRASRNLPPRIWTVLTTLIFFTWGRGAKSVDSKANAF
jgi:hypothetical protein